MRVVLLAPGFEDEESQAARRWLEARRDLQVVAEPNEWAVALSEAEVAWCHVGSRVPDIPIKALTALSDFLSLGGGLLLTLLATPLAQQVGARGPAPLIDTPRPWRDADDPLWPDGFRDWPDYPHIRGIQGWGPHALLMKLRTGTFSWRAREGESWSRSYYRAPVWPTGDVLGVDRAYVQLDAETAVAWHYFVERGCILNIGANVSLGRADHSRDAQRDELLAQAIEIVRQQQRNRHRVWGDRWPRYPRVADTRPLEFTDDTVDTVLADVPQHTENGTPAATPTLASLSMPAPLSIESETPDESPIILAATDVLAVGTESSGIRELWLHPLCLWSEAEWWRCGGRALRAERVIIEPTVVTRELVAESGARWKELVVVRNAELHVWLQPLGEHGDQAELECTLPLRLRLEWPFPSDALQPIHVGVTGDGPGRRVVIRCNDRARGALVELQGGESVSCTTSTSAPTLTIRVRPGHAFSLRASSISRAALYEQRVPVRVQHPVELHLMAQRRQAQRLLEQSVTIETPAQELDRAWKWALARLQSYSDFHDGGAIYAGYAASRPGWSDARPGYAWCFARDTCWMADALLAAGRTKEVDAAIRFLVRWRDVTGKIPHEVTTSLVAHYDAADATPLFLRLFARYAEWTGHLAYGYWEDVEDAYRFVLSTCSRDDALPINTGVGHGWIESGSLGGGAITSYTASIWIDALRRLAPLARANDEVEFANDIDRTEQKASAAFERLLRDPRSGRVALHQRADGSLDATLTALSAVPILLDVDPFDPSQRRANDARATLDALAHPRFSAPWGVRLVPNDSPSYRPTGYHEGAVWPLFTGWVAWADFACDRGDAGLEHLMSIARLPQQRAKGCFDEVLNGDTGEAAGVCPDQGWSAAMLIAPLLHGMLGVRPCASEQRCTIAPSWPASWDRASIRNLKVGATVFSLEMRRKSGVYEYILTHDSGEPLSVRVEDRHGASRDVRLTTNAIVTVTFPDRKQRSDGQR